MVIIIPKRLKLKEPSDVRNLIKAWLRDVVETKTLPFEPKVGGVVVQMLNVWLRSYEVEKLEDIDERLKVLEQERAQKQGVEKVEIPKVRVQAGRN